MPTDWPGLLPVVILAGGGTLIFCAGAFWRRLPEGVLFALALLSAAAAGAAALWITPANPTSEGMLDLGGYARFFTCLFMLITLLTCLFLRQYARARGFAGDELYGLVLFAALGMVLVAGALNWVIFFLGFQLISLSLYVLIAVRKGEAASNEAGLKYFIMSAVASAFLTFGIALLYAVSGTLQVAGSLAALAHPEDLPVVLLALALILVGIGFKTSLVPFHLWTPDVYQGAPAPVTAFLSTGSKVALFAALLRFSLLAADTGVGLLPAGPLGPGGPHHDGGQYHRPLSNANQTPAGLLLHRPDGLSLHDPAGRQTGRPAGPDVLPGGLCGHGPGGLRADRQLFAGPGAV